MAARVLDAYAMMAFFEDEAGADFIRGLILQAEEGNIDLLMSVVNVGEVWCSIARTNSAEIADQYIHEIQGMAIDIVDADWQLTRQAAAFKVNGRIAYGDCFAAALAKTRQAELVTGDEEFKVLQNEIKISWL
jgi:ribonuclease VapC